MTRSQFDHLVLTELRGKSYPFGSLITFNARRFCSSTLGFNAVDPRGNATIASARNRRFRHTFYGSDFMT